MEYAYCQRMYTYDQRDAMHFALNSTISGRNNLWSPGNLAATGCLNMQPVCAPHADFDATRRMICQGGSTTLFDNSWSSAGTSWSWLITGADTFTSVSQNPTITPLTVTGWYNVQFIATNSAGSDTIYKPNYFVVSSTNAVFNEVYSEGFENPNFQYFGYVINNRANNGNQFHRTPGTSLTGAACLMLNNYGTNTKGDIDELITPGYHLDYLTGIKLQFSYAHAAKTTDSSDNTQALKIYTSIDCGQTWTLRWTRYGQALCNAGYEPGYFIPNGAGDWETVTVNLPVSCAVPNVRFKFEYTATEDGDGNNFYLDDINILGTNVGIAETETNSLFSIYPNPGNGNSSIAYSLPEQSPVQAELYDLSGRLVRLIYKGEQQAGSYVLPLGGDAAPLANGTYIVRMLIGDKISAQKFVVSGE
jgi:PKD repeat protein